RRRSRRSRNVNIDPHFAQPLARLIRRFAVLQEGDDPAPLCAEIVHADAGPLREFLPQQRAERLDPRLDGVDPDRHRIARGDRETDLTRDEPLPALEPARVVTNDITVAAGPGGGVEIDEYRFEHSDDVAPHIEETGA